jgi:hypothetical protein
MTLYYFEELTMREIGLTLGVVESRVSQIHASAVVHLRIALRGAIGREVKACAVSADRKDSRTIFRIDSFAQLVSQCKSNHARRI